MADVGGAEVELQHSARPLAGSITEELRHATAQAAHPSLPEVARIESLPHQIWIPWERAGRQKQAERKKRGAAMCPGRPLGCEPCPHHLRRGGGEVDGEAAAWARESVPIELLDVLREAKRASSWRAAPAPMAMRERPPLLHAASREQLAGAAPLRSGRSLRPAPSRSLPLESSLELQIAVTFYASPSEFIVF